MKKTYLQPLTDVLDVELEEMIATSTLIDSSEDPKDAVGAESRFADYDEALFGE